MLLDSLRGFGATLLLLFHFRCCFWVPVPSLSSLSRAQLANGSCAFDDVRGRFRGIGCGCGCGCGCRGGSPSSLGVFLNKRRVMFAIVRKRRPRLGTDGWIMGSERPCTVSIIGGLPCSLEGTTAWLSLHTPQSAERERERERERESER